MDALTILKMIVQAPTLFTYSVFKWASKIDSHKMFITCLVQELMLIVIAVVYGTTPDADSFQLIVLILTVIVSLVFNYLICGLPRTKEDWIYCLTGKGSGVQYKTQSTQTVFINPNADVPRPVAPPKSDAIDSTEDLTVQEQEDVLSKIVVECEAEEDIKSEDKVNSDFSELFNEKIEDEPIATVQDDIITSNQTEETLETLAVATEEDITQASGSTFSFDSKPTVKPSEESKDETHVKSAFDFDDVIDNNAFSAIEDSVRKSSVDYDTMKDVNKVDEALSAGKLVDIDDEI